MTFVPAPHVLGLDQPKMHVLPGMRRRTWLPPHLRRPSAILARDATWQGRRRAYLLTYCWRKANDTWAFVSSQDSSASRLGPTMLRNMFSGIYQAVAAGAPSAPNSAVRVTTASQSLHLPLIDQYLLTKMNLSLLSLPHAQLYMAFFRLSRRSKVILA